MVEAASITCSKLSTSSSSLPGDEVDQAVIRSDRRGDRPLDVSRFTQGLERHPEDPVGIVLDRFSGDLQGEPRLTAAARAGESDQPMFAQQPAGLLEFRSRPTIGDGWMGKFVR